MRKGKMYKKFLSCVLAAAMVVTSGVVYPSTGKAESSESAVERTEFKDHNGKSWYIVPENYLGKKGVIQDAEGILYQLMQDGSKSTAIVIGFESTGNSSITIPSAVPINYENYNKYMESGETPKRMPEGTKWNASDVTVVAERAFASSPIEKVTVPESVLEIRDEAFAFCATLKELHWKVSEKIDVVIGENILNSSSNCKIISSNKVVKQYAQDKKYAISSEEASPSPSDSEIPSDEPTPTQVPTATPVVSTPTVTASIVPTATPAVATSTVPTATPAIATPTVPTATPAVATATPVVATPVAPTATPKVPGHPVVVPPSVTDPVVQTPTPGETLAPTAVPTEVVITPAPASEKPAITEIPAITEAPTVTEVPEKPVEPTPIPAKPTVAPVPETVAEKDNVSYEVNQNTKSVSVSSMSDVKDRKVTIPSTVKINGVTYNVTSIDKNAFRNNKKITTVTIGNNVTTIKAGAFQGCKKLTSVKFPSKLRTISPNSFKGCSKLLTVNMPKTVSKIGEAAFKDCTSLKEVSIGNAPKKNLGGLSFDESQIRYGASTVTINIGAKAFENCKKLNKVIINALVKIIGKSAFKDCKSLRSILIYSKVLKKVKGGALTGVNNCKISVPAKKVAPYKILFKNKGQGKKVVVAKL